MTSRAKQRFGPDRVRNAVFTFTAAVFALAFAAVSEGNDGSAEEQFELPFASGFPVEVPMDPIVLTSSGIPTAIPSKSIRPTAPASTVNMVQVQPKPPVVRQQVVVPFPRARSRAS